MRLVLTYLRFHKAPLQVAGVVILTVALLGLIFSIDAVPSGFTALGNRDATRQRDPHVSLPRYDTAPLPRPIAAPILSARSGVTAHLPPSAEYHAPLLEALNCAREHAGLPALIHEPALDGEAAAVWQAMVAQPNVGLAALAQDRYTLVSIVPLTLASVVAEPSAASTQNALQAQRCVMRGTEMAQLDLSGITTIGVAVFPDPNPEDGLDDSSAIIVGK
jgi:hypothetical protein